MQLIILLNNQCLEMAEPKGVFRVSGHPLSHQIEYQYYHQHKNFSLFNI